MNHNFSPKLRRCFALLFLIGSLFLAGGNFKIPQSVTAKTEVEVSDEVIIKRKTDLRMQTSDNKSNEDWDKKGENFEFELLPKEGRTLEEIQEELKDDESIEYIQENYIYEFFLDRDPRDPYFQQQYSLENNGQIVGGVTGIKGADMGVTRAWKNTEHNYGVVVAVLDSGVLWNHEDLIGQMWNGAGCRDKDGQYLGNCVHGYDFFANDRDPAPGTNPHGTQVAGIIGANLDNGKGIAGLNSSVKIMAIKTGDWTTSTYAAVSGINFAKHNGAKIVNASFGSAHGSCYGAYDQALYEAIRDFPGLVVAAAGNNGARLDSNYVIRPASFAFDSVCWTGLENMIVVSASNNRDQKADFSNYGQTHVFAPGVNIYTTSSHSTSSYNTISGTSAAAPNVSGAVSIIMSSQPSLTLTEVRRLLLEEVDIKSDLECTTGGRINVARSLATARIVTQKTGSEKYLYRFWSKKYKSHFFTISYTEAVKVATTDKNWRYEGVAYNVSDQQIAGTVPVYRFWSANYKAHFYTTSEEEKKKLEETDKNWRYEHVAFYVYPNNYTGKAENGKNTRPVYRFWSTNYKSHFFTASESEMNKTKNDKNWKYERVAWRVSK